MPIPADCLAKINWAETHLTALGEIEGDYIATEPYQLDHEPAADGRVHVFRLRLASPLPPDAALIMGDLLHNVRSTLDTLVFALSELGKGCPLTAEEERATQFPITMSQDNWEHAARQVALVPPDARSLIYDMQPFRDADDKDGYRPLERLANLSNTDKHRRLAVLSQTPRMGMLRSGERSLPQWQWHTGPVTDGQEVCRLLYDRPTALRADALLASFALCLADSDGSEATDLHVIGTRLIAWVRHRVLKSFTPFFPG